jgi:hypothetical protein
LAFGSSFFGCSGSGSFFFSSTGILAGTFSTESALF